MKMYKKEDCQYKGGYIVCGDDVVGVPNQLVALVNRVEHDVQFAKFTAERKAKPVEEAVFAIKSEHAKPITVQADTPKLDEFVAKSIEIMDDIDLIGKVDELQKYIDEIEPVFAFAEEDFVISHDQQSQLRFDLPTLGNPLELTAEKLQTFAQAIIEANHA